jgi:hypothetical protein
MPWWLPDEFIFVKLEKSVLTKRTPLFFFADEPSSVTLFMSEWSALHKINSERCSSDRLTDELKYFIGLSPEPVVLSILLLQCETEVV